MLLNWGGVQCEHSKQCQTLQVLIESSPKLALSRFLVRSQFKSVLDAPLAFIVQDPANERTGFIIKMDASWSMRHLVRGTTSYTFISSTSFRFLFTVDVISKGAYRFPRKVAGLQINRHWRASSVLLGKEKSPWTTWPSASIAIPSIPDRSFRLPRSFGRHRISSTPRIGRQRDPALVSR